MKGLYKLYICLAMCFGMFTLTGCEDLLDKEYDASLSEEKVFNNTTLTKQYLANLYTLLPDGLGHFSDGQYKNASRDCMTDNASSFWGLIYYNKIRTDSYTSNLLAFVIFSVVSVATRFLALFGPCHISFHPYLISFS